MPSVFGLVDLLSILQLSWAFLCSGYFAAVRALRLIRVFRIFKLAQFLKASNHLMTALRASQAKITVFLTFVLMMTIVIGSFMYLIEGGEGSSFTSIPRSIYWAIVTLTTVGYGDIAPVTPLGQFVAAMVMIMGYGVIAVPTGIVSAEIANSGKDEKKPTTQACKDMAEDLTKISFCKYCGFGVIFHHPSYK